MAELLCGRNINMSGMCGAAVGDHIIAESVMKIRVEGTRAAEEGKNGEDSGAKGSASCSYLLSVFD